MKDLSAFPRVSSVEEQGPGELKEQRKRNLNNTTSLQKRPTFVGGSCSLPLSNTLYKSAKLLFLYYL